MEVQLDKHNMRNILLIICITLVSNALNAQDYNFLPKWKVGETKIVNTTEYRKEYKNGNLIKDTIEQQQYKIKVKRDDASNYYIVASFKNIALKSAVNAYAKFGEDVRIKDYKNLNLEYKVSKTTGKMELQNWEDARDFMNKSFDLITELMEEKSPEMSEAFKMSITPLKNMFSSKETTEEYVKEWISFIEIPYNKNFVLGDTLITYDSAENPMNPGQIITTQTNLMLSKVNLPNNSVKIEHSIVFDMTEFMEMMKEMMRGMAEAFAAAAVDTEDVSEEEMEAKENARKDKMKELDDMVMEMDNEQYITYNTSTTWVTSIVSLNTVNAETPGVGGSKSIVKIVYEIK